jgi:hypothetical protein
MAYIPGKGRGIANSGGKNPRKKVSAELTDKDIIKISLPTGEKGEREIWTDYGEYAHINHDFWINDLKFEIGVESISSNEQNSIIATESLRSSGTEKIPIGSGLERFDISITLPSKDSLRNYDIRDNEAEAVNTGKRGGLLDLIIQFKHIPLAVIENAVLRTRLKIPPTHNMVFALHNLALTITRGSVEAMLSIVPITYVPYSDMWLFKKYWISNNGQSLEIVNSINLDNRNPYLTKERINEILASRKLSVSRESDADSHPLGISKFLYKAASVDTAAAAGQNPGGVAPTSNLIDPKYQILDSMNNLDITYMAPYEVTLFPRESEPFKGYVDWLHSQYQSKQVNLSGERYDFTKVSPYGSVDHDFGNKTVLKWKEFRNIQIDPQVASAIKKKIKDRIVGIQKLLFEKGRLASYPGEGGEKVVPGQPKGQPIKSADGSITLTRSVAVDATGKICFFGDSIRHGSSSVFGQIRGAETDRAEFINSELKSEIESGDRDWFGSSAREKDPKPEKGYRFHKGIDLFPNNNPNDLVPVYTPFNIRITHNTADNKKIFLTNVDAVRQGIFLAPANSQVRRGDNNGVGGYLYDTRLEQTFDGKKYVVYRFNKDSWDSGHTGAKIIGEILDEGPLKGKSIFLYHMAWTIDTSNPAFSSDPAAPNTTINALAPIGSVIPAGSLVGFMGSTAVQSSLPHLHVEVGDLAAQGRGSLRYRKDITTILANITPNPPIPVIDAYYRKIYPNDPSITYDNVNRLTSKVDVAGSAKRDLVEGAIKDQLGGVNNGVSEDNVRKNKDLYPLEFYALQIKDLESLGYRLYTEDATAIDLFYKEHQIVITDFGNDVSKQSIRVFGEQGFVYKSAAEETQRDLTLAYVSCGAKNEFKFLPVQGVLYPTAQYLGRQDTEYEFAIKCNGLNALKLLEVLRDTMRQQSLSFKYIPEAYCIRIENNAINAFGDLYFMISAISVAPIREEPNSYVVEMRVIANNVIPKTQKIKKESITDSSLIKKLFIEELLGTSFSNGQAPIDNSDGQDTTKQIEAAENFPTKASIEQLTQINKEKEAAGVPYLIRDAESGYIYVKVREGADTLYTKKYLDLNRYIYEIAATINLCNKLIMPDNYWWGQSGYSEREVTREFSRREMLAPFIRSGLIGSTKLKDEPYGYDTIRRWRPNDVDLGLEKEGNVESKKFQDYIKRSHAAGLEMAPWQWDYFLEDREVKYDFSNEAIRLSAFTGIGESLGAYYSARGMWGATLADKGVSEQTKYIVPTRVWQAMEGDPTLKDPGTMFPYIATHRKVLALAENTLAIAMFYKTVMFTNRDGWWFSSFDTVDGVWKDFFDGYAVEKFSLSFKFNETPFSLSYFLTADHFYTERNIVASAGLKTNSVNSLLYFDRDEKIVNKSHKFQKESYLKDIDYLQINHRTWTPVAPIPAPNQPVPANNIGYNWENNSGDKGSVNWINYANQNKIFKKIGTSSATKLVFGEPAKVDPRLTTNALDPRKWGAYIEFNEAGQDWYEQYYGTRENESKFLADLRDGELDRLIGIDRPGKNFMRYIWNYLIIPYLNNVFRFTDIYNVATSTDWFPLTKARISATEQNLIQPAYEDLMLPLHPYWNEKTATGAQRNIKRGASFTEPDFYLMNPGVDIQNGEEVAVDYSQTLVNVTKPTPVAAEGETGEGMAVATPPARNTPSKPIPHISARQFRNLYVEIAAGHALGEQEGLASVSTNSRRMFPIKKEDRYVGQLVSASNQDGDSIVYYAEERHSGGSNDPDNNANLMAMGPTEEERYAMAREVRAVVSDTLNRFNAHGAAKAKQDKTRDTVQGHSTTVISWNELLLSFGDNIDLIAPLGANISNTDGKLLHNPLLNYTYQQYNYLGTELLMNRLRSGFRMGPIRKRGADGGIEIADLGNSQIVDTIGKARAEQTGIGYDGPPAEVTDPGQYKELLTDFYGIAGPYVGDSSPVMQSPGLRYPIWAKIKESLRSLNRKKLAGRKAYPNVKIYFYEEDDIYNKYYFEVDEVYTYSYIESIEISESRKRPAAIAKIIFSDANGILSGSNQLSKAANSNEGSSTREEPSTGAEETLNIFLKEGKYEQNENGFSLNPGMKIKVKLGHSNDSNKLEEVFLGEITDVNLDSNSDRIEVYAMSYGAELATAAKGNYALATSTDPVIYNDTFDLLANIMFTEEIVHFGKRKIDDVVMFTEDQSLQKHAIQYQETLGAGALYNEKRRGSAIGLLYDLNSPGRAVGGFFQDLAHSFIANIDKAARQKSLSPTGDGTLCGPQDDNIFAPNFTGSQMIWWTDNIRRWCKTMTGDFNITSDKDLIKVDAYPKDENASLVDGGFWTNFVRGGTNRTERFLTSPGRRAWRQGAKAAVGLVAAVYGADKLGGAVGKFSNKALYGEIGKAVGGVGAGALVGWIFDAITNAEADALAGNDDGYWIEAYTIDELLYTPYYSTVWDIFEEMTYRHPGYVKHPRIYGNSNRMTMFFGMPDQNMWREAGDKSDVFKANRLFLDMAMEAEEGYINQVQGFNTALSEVRSFRTFDSSGINLKSVQNALGDQRVRAAKTGTARYDVLDALIEAGGQQSVTIRVDKDGDKYEEIKNLSFQLVSSADKVLEFLKLVKRRFKPFREWHHINSYTDIISNDIEATADGWYTEVTVQFSNVSIESAVGTEETVAIGENAIRTPNSFIKWDERNAVTRRAHVDLSPFYIRGTTYQFVNCKSKGMAKRYARALLAKQGKEMYKGSVLVHGSPHIKPYDVVMINDTYSNMYGPIEVEEVHHMFSKDTGFVTQIYPDTLIVHDDVTPYLIFNGIKAEVYMKTELYSENASLVKPFVPDINASVKGTYDLITGLKAVYAARDKETSANLKELSNALDMWEDFKGGDDPAGQGAIIAAGALTGTLALRPLLALYGEGGLYRTMISKASETVLARGVTPALWALPALALVPAVAMSPFFYASAKFSEFVMNYVAESRAYFMIPLVKEGYPLVAGTNISHMSGLYKTPLEYMRQYFMDGGRGLSLKNADMLMDHSRVRERYGRDLSGWLQVDMQYDSFKDWWDRAWLRFGENSLDWVGSIVMDDSITNPIANLRDQTRRDAEDDKIGRYVDENGNTIGSLYSLSPIEVLEQLKTANRRGE